MSAGVVLDQLSTSDLERRLFWSEDDLVPHSPITEMFVGDGMTVRQLLDAALTVSDNTATNVLFELVGGPGAVEDRLAVLGDTVIAGDRVEPDLNDWQPGERRDTSTPRALADVVRDLVLGGARGGPRWSWLQGRRPGGRGGRTGRSGPWRVWAAAIGASGTPLRCAPVACPERSEWR